MHSPQQHFHLYNPHQDHLYKTQSSIPIHLEHSNPYPLPSPLPSSLSLESIHTMSESTHPSTEPPIDHVEIDGMASDGEGEHDNSRERSSSPDSGRDTKGDQDFISTKKKPRITLARGGACVACRNRKLKCTGERPCKTCLRANIECRYEELPRKKPRAVMLEERVAELEAYLHLKAGEPLPKHDHDHRGSQSQTSFTPILTPPDHGHGIELRPTTSSSDNTASSSSGHLPPPISLLSHRDLPPPPNMAAVNTTRTDIGPGSQLELALIQVVLPYAPYLLMPIHPQRFLALLTLPASNPGRPHPALLNILFSEAVRILEQNVPLPQIPRLPPTLFINHPFVAPPANVDVGWVLRQVRGSSASLLERARTELDNGIRNVDRPYDLARAAIGIARALYGLGRFIEGWNIPVSRLIISCGLHRQTGVYVPPDGNPNPRPESMEFVPKPYAPAHYYRHTHSLDSLAIDPSNMPVIRMRPVIIPPARDEIEIAERVMTFWAAKAQDWEAGIGWGWSVSMDDTQCTTEWGWGWGACEPKPNRPIEERFAIRDLYDSSSALHTNPHPDTTYILALKSLGILHRASTLFDMPEANYPFAQADGRIAPTHIATLESIQSVETSIRQFRQRIPAPFIDRPQNSSRSPLETDHYDGPLDPWWIMCHADLYAAEMIMYREMAHYRRSAYETSIGCARAIVGLVQKVPPEVWANVVAFNMSLASRFLYKESDRLSQLGQHTASKLANDEAEILRTCLGKEYSKWLPMASLHSLIVQRVREGWPEKEGEYERV